MAFNVDLTENDGLELPVDGMGKSIVLKRTVDFSEAANYLANTETMGLFLIPAYVLVEEVIMVVKTADADISDVDIGRFSTAGVVAAVDAFVDGATLVATGILRDLAGETYSRQDGTAGYVSEDDWAIGLTNNDAQTINEAVVDFFAICKDLR